jgi:pyruvate formate lyase activating enzyme
MILGALQKFSLIDFPGRVCAVVFTRGCNFRCPYCHNPELIGPGPAGVAEEDLFAFLALRRGKLDAVTITGGEPLVHSDLLPFIRRVRESGFQVKLDTNGSLPDRLEEIILPGVLDYIAMDIKAPPDKYPEAVRAEVDPDRIRRSIRLIMDSGIDYEFRTTLVRSRICAEDVLRIGKEIEGARRYVLQRFIPSKTLDPLFVQEVSWPEETLGIWREKLAGYVQRVLIR